ncbi:MAG: SAM-dependent methyltransferase [Phycisphaerae bacterium]|nr:SAM-dependent methyltransferase [Phycisphaerae bacterium]MBM92999.1 SAM-dependent methyltransferase [Phycisphaerae bacterium]
MSEPKPTESASDPQPAFVYATTRDWPGYFEVTQGRPPRETLLHALELYSNEPTDQTRCAVDLGCGEGRDTAELLRAGWRVHAIDGHPDGLTRLMHRNDHDAHDRLTMQLAPFERIDPPRCDLLNASFSLPFCEPAHFESLWDRIVEAINEGGRFSGQLFGDRDSWAAIPDRSHHTREQVEAFLAPFSIEMLKEEEREGQDCNGISKHWHVYHIVARKNG